ncbi:hypothetical protein Tco_0570778, partial [Tanacetum coccineum]
CNKLLDHDGLLIWLAYGDDDDVAFVHIDFAATISRWTVMGQTDPYLGGVARSRVCSLGGSNTLLSGYALTNLSQTVPHYQTLCIVAIWVCCVCDRWIVVGEIGPYLGRVAHHRACSYGGSHTLFSSPTLTNLSPTFLEPAIIVFVHLLLIMVTESKPFYDTFLCQLLYVQMMKFDENGSYPPLPHVSSSSPSSLPPLHVSY